MPIASLPESFRSPSTATKKGVHRVEPSLPELPSRCPIRLPQMPRSPDRHRARPTPPSLVPLRFLRQRRVSRRRVARTRRPLHNGGFFDGQSRRHPGTVRQIGGSARTTFGVARRPRHLPDFHRIDAGGELLRSRNQHIIYDFEVSYFNMSSGNLLSSDIYAEDKSKSLDPFDLFVSAILPQCWCAVEFGEMNRNGQITW